jgi:V/A-type H+-transporting ATPase subunit I
MRLFALGLASASLALTFNQLAGQVAAAEGGLALLGGGLILLLGHLVNIGLGVMSGVVHGLRLNFIEFYNWGEPGEGYAFQPFQLKELEDE